MDDILDSSTLPDAAPAVSPSRLATAFQTCDSSWRTPATFYQDDNPQPLQEADQIARQHAYPSSRVVADTAPHDGGLSWSIVRFSFGFGDGDQHLGSLRLYALPAIG